MKRRIVAIAVALAVAIIGAISVISYANSADARAVAGQKVTEVFIATKPVPQGTTAQDAVAQKLVNREKVVAKGVPIGAMTTLKPAMNDQVALDDIPAGTVLLNASFGAKSQVKTTTGVPKGEVAVSLSLSDPAGIAPLIDSGSHIAIYDTFNSRGSGALVPDGRHLSDDKPSVRGTAVVLPDVEVLRVGGKPTADSGGSSSSNLLVTVTVPPNKATRLVHAIQTGTLYAALLGEGAKVDQKSTTSDNTVVKH